MTTALLNAPPTPTPEPLDHLAEQRVLDNLGLLFHVAAKRRDSARAITRDPNLERDELASIAFPAYRQACRRFDPDRGFQLSTYIVAAVSNELTKRLSRTRSVKRDHPHRGENLLRINDHGNVVEPLTSRVVTPSAPRDQPLARFDASLLRRRAAQIEEAARSVLPTRSYTALRMFLDGRTYRHIAAYLSAFRPKNARPYCRQAAQLLVARALTLTLDALLVAENDAMTA